MIKTRHEGRSFQKELISLEYLLSYHLYEAKITLHAPGCGERSINTLVNYGYFNKQDIQVRLDSRSDFRDSVVDAVLFLMGDTSDESSPYERYKIAVSIFKQQNRRFDNYLLLLEESILSEFKSGMEIDADTLRSSPGKLIAVCDMLAGGIADSEMQGIIGNGKDILVVDLAADYGKVLLRLSLKTPEGFVYTPTLIDTERRSEVMEAICSMCKEMRLSIERTKGVCDQGEWLTGSPNLSNQNHLVGKGWGYQTIA